MSRACDDLAELRSGFVDGALAPEDRERVVTHLLACAACRADVAELRSMRDLLGRAGRAPGSAVPLTSLADRLVSIAGDASARPWTQAFDGSRRLALPSARRRARVRALLASLAVAAVLGAVGVTGWFAAPGNALGTVPDPADEAQAEFGAAAAQLSVTGASLSALMLLDSLPEATQDGTDVRRPSTKGVPDGNKAAAVALLDRAMAAGRTTTVVGRQTVLARVEDRMVAAQVAIDTRGSRGTAVSVFGSDGTVLASSTAPSPVLSSDGPSPVDLIAQDYTLRTISGAEVAGRRATIVEARDDQGVVAQRWWVDDATGVLLWQESYDADGLSTAAGFTAVKVVAYAVVSAPIAGGQVLAAAVASADADELSRSGWTCQDEMAGLDLLQVSTDTPDDPRSVHFVYGNGASTVSVLQQRGRLGDAPAGAQWDAKLLAWRHAGAVRRATWQSGDVVYTVTTDGPASLLRRAVGSFPHAGPTETTTLGRVREGWSEILADLKG